MRHSLVERFRRVDNGVKARLARERSVLKVGLAVLAIAQDRFSTEYMSLEEIVEAADRMGVALGKTSLGRAVARAGKRIRGVGSGDARTYKAMGSGKDYVGDLVNDAGSDVIYVEGGKPRSARKKLATVLAGLSGEVRICDPYYGLKSLDSLEMIPRTCRVRLLSGTCSDRAAAMHNAVADFKREYSNIEIGVYPRPRELHDRYVLTDTELFLIGHGLKDIGNKESFIVKLAGDIARDLLQSLRTAFDARWANSAIL